MIVVQWGLSIWSTKFPNPPMARRGLLLTIVDFVQKMFNLRSVIAVGYDNSCSASIESSGQNRLVMLWDSDNNHRLSFRVMLSSLDCTMK